MPCSWWQRAGLLTCPSATCALSSATSTSATAFWMVCGDAEAKGDADRLSTSLSCRLSSLFSILACSMVPNPS